MPATKNQALSASFVRSVKATGAYTDGNGLVFRVADNGRKTWIQRVSIGGKQRNVGLGSYPTVGLSDARQAAIENSRAIQAGRDILAERRQAKEDAKQRAIEDAAPVLTVPTFREMADTVITLRAPTWSSERHAKQWIESLTNHAYPVLGDMPIDEITTADILRTLTPIWTSKVETARRVRQRVEVILDYAIAENWRTDGNPAGKAVTRVLPKMPQVKEHHPALPYQQLPDLIQTIRESTADTVTRLAFEFMALTAARAGEVRGATWSEIDWDSRTWEIPAARMKARRPHTVPLSTRAIEILRDAWEISGQDGGLIFPTKRSGKPMSNMVFEMLLRRLEIPAVPHGLRSSFKDWTIEQTSTPWAVGEAALAHRLGDSVESAYARTTALEQRRELMQQWADFLTVTG